jgi:hypothetical protein
METFVLVLGFEFRALSLLGRWYSTWTMPPALFALDYFSDRVLHFLPGLVLDCNICTSAFRVARIIDVYHYSSLRWRLLTCTTHEIFLLVLWASHTRNKDVWLTLRQKKACLPNITSRIPEGVRPVAKREPYVKNESIDLIVVS